MSFFLSQCLVYMCQSLTSRQTSAYEVCDRSETFCTTHILMIKMSFRHAVYFTSQIKRFYNLHIARIYWQRINCLQLYYLVHPCFFKTQKKHPKMVENSIKIIQYLNIFSDITFYNFFF